MMNFRFRPQWWTFALGWTVTGSKPEGVRISAPVQTCPKVHADSCKIGIGSLPRRSSGRGVALTTHPHLQPRLKKE